MNKKQEKQCKTCKNKPVWTNYNNKTYCETHFLELIEKRIRKNLRLNKFNQKTDYYIIKNNYVNQKIMVYYIKKIFNERINILEIKKQEQKHVSITKTSKKKENKEKKQRKELKDHSMDDLCESLIEKFLENKKINKTEESLQPISILTNQEINITAKLLKIKGKTRKKQLFLEEIEKKHKETIYSLNKSRKFIDEKY